MANKGYILMLEGDEHDRELSKTYFDSHKISFAHLKLSSEVIPFLKDKQINGSFPALILLTLNSFPDNGLEVLKSIKGMNEFNYIPVVILGESTQSDLVKQCYANGASTFINKPFTDKLTDKTIASFIEYWFQVAELPEQNKLSVLF